MGMLLYTGLSAKEKAAFVSLQQIAAYSLVPISGDSYRLVVMKGEVLDTDIIPGIPMNHTFFRPDNGVKEAMTKWLRYGGTHHQVLWTGDWVERLELLCNILDIEFVDVSQ